MGIEEMHNLYSGKVFMVGNGPSLLNEDLSLLSQQFTWCCNGIYLWPHLSFIPSFYGISANKRHMMESINEREMWLDVQKFILKRNFPSYGLEAGWVWVEGGFHLSLAQEGFAGLEDYWQPIPAGRATPLTQAQIAAWLGFTEFYFIGNENTRYGHVYGATGPLAERRKDGGLGALLNEREWQENERATLEAFARAKGDVVAAGRKMYDCTKDGMMVREGILEYVELADAVAA